MPSPVGVHGLVSASYGITAKQLEFDSSDMMLVETLLECRLG